MNDAELIVEREGALVTLTLNRPEVRNALSPGMRDGLLKAVGDVQVDSSVHAVLLRGAGEHFCSGGDVKAMADGGTPTAQARLERMRSYHPLIIGLAQLDRPVVAAVDGVAYGAGFGLALLADIMIVSSRARFCMAFQRVGLVPDFGASYSLPRAVGMQRAKEIMLSAREIHAEEAVSLGLALETVAAGCLHERAKAVALALADASPVATGLTKRMLQAAPSAGLPQMLEMESTAQSVAATSAYAAQAFAAFARKQPARFRWPARE
ncbi:enoyl-CoA hydratase/isomerase family protein [Alcaligenaceae bacterium]|nr:enoyl-CoA hydratase/isomerase family protein [Alcaligenaceae bacterium]